MKILLADDDLTMRILLSELLTKFGYDVLSVPDGHEAWEILRNDHSFRLAIVDWIMPKLSGIELCKLTREYKFALSPYLILLTARSQKNDIAEGLKSGADDYLIKPFDPIELSARIEVGSRIIALQDKLSAKVQELESALAHIKTLKGIIPICSSCKKIRDDRGFWNQVEAYVSAHSEAKFSHGLCPQCTAKLYPDYINSLQYK